MDSEREEAITVVGARENNLRDVTVTIPKRQVTVVTGISGSGKSSLVFDVLARESERQLAATFPAHVRHRLPHHPRPEVDSIAGLGVAVVIDQRRLGGSRRSTVGTATEIFTLLRILFSRAGRPSAGESSAYSFNDPRGMCPGCEGLGEVTDVDLAALLDETRSIREGAIRFPTFEPGGVRWKRYVDAGVLDVDKPIREYDDRERRLLLDAEPFRPPHPRPGFPATARYEGLRRRFRRTFLADRGRGEAARRAADIERVVRTATCTRCGGRRLAEGALRSTIDGCSIADVSGWEVREVSAFLAAITDPALAPVVSAAQERIAAMVDVGLGYLTLDRATPTLSGGESQRVKLVRHLGSSLTDLTYIADEPTIGLHPADVERLIGLLRRLCERGNTVVVVEHDPAVIAVADHVIDLGPGAGADGGTVVFAGTVAGLRQAETPTGTALSRQPRLKARPRNPSGQLAVRGADEHNLRGLDVDVPLGVVCAVTGVAGSGKSTFALRAVPRAARRASLAVSVVDQTPPPGSTRSSVATYLGLADPIRAAFAVASNRPAGLFSANSQGACPECGGVGVVRTDLAYLEPVTSRCAACDGTGFSAEALAYRVAGGTIADVLNLTVAEALDHGVAGLPGDRLAGLSSVRLAHLRLGQSVASMSGGERQRLKLAAALASGADSLYLIDEPTAGLHPADVAALIDVLDRLADRSAGVLVVEHDLRVIAAADHVIDLGPGAGSDGGRLLFSGRPGELAAAASTPTGRYLRAAA